MKNSIIVTSLIIITVVFASCRKDDHPHTETPSGSITILKPYEEQTFIKGDTVNIEAKLSANIALHGYEIAIITESGDTVFRKDNHIHQNEILVHEQWVDTFPTPASLKVVISTELDHHGNHLEKSASFKVQ